MIAKSHIPALALLLLFSGCGESKKKGTDPAEDRIETQGGISVIPRGKVMVATSKGEQFLLEVEAPVSLEQAVAFYRGQLPRDRWEDVRLASLSPEVWGIQASRGMFELTGRIKRLDAERVSIGFERRVRTATAGWIPPVAREVVTLPEAIRWDDRVFEAGGARVELRGRSELGQEALRGKLESALGAAGWTVETRPPDHVKAVRKGTKPPRELAYRLEALPRGTQVGLTLGLTELVEARRPSPDTRPAPRPEVRPSEDLAPVPEDLVLWKGESPPAGRKDGEGLLTVTFERPCTALDEILKDVEKQLVARGWKPMSKTEMPGGSSDLSPTSLTATKGRRLVVAIVNREISVCTVSLMVTDK